MFPLKLPPQFHGQVKPHRLPSQIYQQKCLSRDHDVYPVNKVSKWQKKISDGDIMRERQQFLVHPAKISEDNPNWLKSTYHHFQRGNQSQLKRYRHNEAKQFDVFGNKRKLHIEAYQSEKEFTFKPIRHISDITPKIGYSSVHTTTPSIRESRLGQKVDIAWKIGSSDIRGSQIKRPQLKIGSTQSHNFINTYSVN